MRYARLLFGVFLIAVGATIEPLWWGAVGVALGITNVVLWAHNEGVIR